MLHRRLSQLWHLAAEPYGAVSQPSVYLDRRISLPRGISQGACY